MSDVIQLFKEFKDEAEKQKFLEKQQSVITNLLNQNKQLHEEIDHLKHLLTTTLPALTPQENAVERIIITQEEGLLDSQIDIIAHRSVNRELTLEDTKKLDLLLKNKKILKEERKAIETTSTPVPSKRSNSELIQIALTKKPNESV